MIIFETERLIIKPLTPADRAYFIELFDDPQIIAPIPQPKLSKATILQRFHDNIGVDNVLEREKTACGIFEKGNPEMIGLCLFLTNEEKDKELGYRFRVKYWGKGYGTETTKGMIHYYFHNLQVDKVTADVNIENTASVKILSKFMQPVCEFFNPRDHCTDRRYAITKTSWMQKEQNDD